jgi:hypothetical protein
MASTIRTIICLLVLFANPCMGGQQVEKLSKRDMAPKEYNQTIEQNFKDEMNRKIQDLERRVEILERKG